MIDEADIAALRRHGGQGEAGGVGAVLVDELQRVDDVALGLAHLLALFVADQGMHVDRVERLFIQEFKTHHHHAGNPEENDVEAGDQNVGRIIAAQFGGLVRPAQGRERPEGGREPGVEHVLVALERQSADRNGHLPAACASASS